MVECPTVISLQGLLGPCSEWYHFFGNNSLMDIVKMHRWLEIPAMRGLWTKFRMTRKIAKREREIMWQPLFYRSHRMGSGIRPCPASVRALLIMEGKCCGRRSGTTDGTSDARGDTVSFLRTPAVIPEKEPRFYWMQSNCCYLNYPDIQVAIAGGISRQKRLWKVCSRPDRRTGRCRDRTWTVER